MQQSTRRGFLRATSLGAAAAGVLAALPTFVFAQEQTPGAPSSASMSTPKSALQSPAMSPMGGASIPFTVFVNGPGSTDAVIYVGEQAIPLTDASVVQYLRQVAAGA
jgi:hypothetical protein